MNSCVQQLYNMRDFRYGVRNLDVSLYQAVQDDDAPTAELIRQLQNTMTRIDRSEQASIDEQGFVAACDCLPPFQALFKSN